MAMKHVNAIVVGAGAGGGIAAKELAEAGLSVVLLERGRFQTYDDHDDDELISQRTTVLGNAFGPDDERYRRVVLNSDGSKRIVYPSEGGYNNNAGCVGGGTFSYGAMAWRFMPQDFKLRSTYANLAAELKNSSLEDWPISYEDLEPCYEKAEWEVGVSGDDAQNPFAPPRKKPHPMPPFQYNKEGKLIYDTTKRMGLHPFPIPMLRNSRPYGGRPQCINRRACVGFACPVNAKNGSHNTVIPKALATGNCELRTECKAAEILVNEKGRATGVRYFDREDKEQVQTADIVIISASATETARLLLNSKSKLFKFGAGNNHDWVGRNLQGHAYPSAKGIVEEDLYEEAGPGACVAICDFNHNNAGLIGGAMLANEFIRLPYLFSQGMLAPGTRNWGKTHKDYMRKNYQRVIAIMGPVQEIPNPEARVTVDAGVRDYWGVPVVALSGTRHEYDVKVAAYIATKAEAIVKACGATKTWTGVPGRWLSGGQHQAGTCRMGNDPKTSVTNRYGQVHEIDNLFIADGSLNVTNGGFNPALTIMALAYWVSSHIVTGWRGSRFK